MCVILFSNLTDGQPSVVLSMMYLPAINSRLLQVHAFGEH